MRKLAQWFLGDLPEGYPPDRLRGYQGLKGVKKLLLREDKREMLNETLSHRAYPSGLIVRLIRRTIVRVNYLRIQVWVDELRDRMAFRILERQHRSLEEIVTWRDHYYLLRFGYFVACLFLLPLLLASGWRYPIYILSALLLLDMVAGLAGSALVWHRQSASYERSFLNSLVNYIEVIVAFAGFYRACGCLNVQQPGALRALYFSTVAATTVGFGDIHPLGSDGLVACRSGLLLVTAQLLMTVLFGLVLVNIFLSRSVNVDGAATSATKVGSPPESGPA